MLLFIPLIPVALIAGLLVILKCLKNKNILLLGPPGSGKTTFLSHFDENNDIPKSATGSAKNYKVKIKDTSFDVTDMGGGEEHIVGRMEELIDKKKCDYILFFFDVKKYLEDNKYSGITNARLQFLDGNGGIGRTVVIGTHIDEVHNFNVAEIDSKLASAATKYSNILEHKVYVNTEKREDCTKKIYEELKKLNS